MNLKICPGCGLEKSTTEFHKHHSRPDGLAFNCKTCRKLEKRAYYEKYKDKVAEHSARKVRTLRGRYGCAKARAKGYNLVFEITLEQYAELVKAKCYYSGHDLPVAGSGLDRIDSAKGYTIDNVRPCCQICNKMKNDLSESAFYLHVRSIVARSPFL